MRILSVNVNTFGGGPEGDGFYTFMGLKGVKGWDDARKEWDALAAPGETIDRHVRLAVGYVVEHDPDVVIMPEHGNLLDCSANMAESMQQVGFDSIQKVSRYAGGSCMPIALNLYVKNSLKHHEVDVPFSDSGRISAIRLEEKDVIVCGAHVKDATVSPETYKDSMLLWRSLTQMLDEHREERLVFAGDFNVYKPGTPQRHKLDSLRRLGAKDVWHDVLARDNDTFTWGQSRIDYVLATDALLRSGTPEMEIDDSTLKWTDHAALVFEM